MSVALMEIMEPQVQQREKKCSIQSAVDALVST